MQLLKLLSTPQVMSTGQPASPSACGLIRQHLNEQKPSPTRCHRVRAQIRDGIPDEHLRLVATWGDAEETCCTNPSTGTGHSCTARASSCDILPDPARVQYLQGDDAARG
ncbi:hypothetical protein GCM10022416_23200 [Actinomadura keratinilytica]|uniref:Uncharacterized protein n=1 Tax=Actinomadura keratinilytica TaxID=547461 RepID=A0ABP7YLT9_9ACTN